MHAREESSVVDPDPGSGALLAPGSGIRDGKKSGSGIRTEYPRSYFQVIRIAIIWVIGNKGGFFGIFLFYVRYSTLLFICRPSDSTVCEDAGIEPRTVIHNSAGT